MKLLFKALTASSLIFYLTTAAAAPAEAVDAGKRLTILTSSAPGGGNDIRARLVARHFSKYLPGSPSVIVQNMPGGGHLIMNNYLNNIAKADAPILGQTVRGIYWFQLMGAAEARFDLTKVHWIGSTSGEDSTLVVRSNLGHKSLEDVRKSGKPLVLGCSGPATSNYSYGQLLEVALSVPVKLLCGYSGTATIKAAMARGEVDGLAGRSISNLLTIDKEEVEKGLWSILVQYGEKRHPSFASVPTSLELARTEDARAIVRAATADSTIGWPFYVRSDMPAERVTLLRKAFMATMKDRDFLREAEKLAVPIEPMSGEELDKVVREALKVPPEMMPKLKLIYYGPEGEPKAKK
jgi:tripartite-type tricarboxylate transporter receptor subunit TctC